MKTSEMKRLETDMNASAELREQFQAAIKRITAEAQLGSDGEVMEKAAAEFGYNIKAAELERFLAEIQQLSIDELNSTVGGIGDRQDPDGHDAWCLTVWNCFTVTLHNISTPKPTAQTHSYYNSACWSDYRCIAIYYSN